MKYSGLKIQARQAEEGRDMFWSRENLAYLIQSRCVCCSMLEPRQDFFHGIGPEIPL
jgi:hypothetical protein